MRTRGKVAEWVAQRRAVGAGIAFVPTMGSLHRGHTSLVAVGAATGDLVVLSIFVNPLQFGPSEDFNRYPRELDRDLEIAREAGVDLVFAPAVEEMYPDGDPWIAVVPERGADKLCGATRPGHFRGVLTVVAKLFGIVRPDLAVFGQKDFQQLMLIRRMAADLELGVRVVGAPIVRDDDGLALSSRNRYLSTEERVRALTLSAALRECERLFASGEARRPRYVEAMVETVGDAARIEYADVVDPDSLEAVDPVTGGALCAIAARVGGTRLIDNTILGSPSRL